MRAGTLVNSLSWGMSRLLQCATLVTASQIKQKSDFIANNFNKRLIKAPKLYFYDTGLACSLLKLTSSEMVSTYYLYGALFENFVISEIIKFQYHSGLRPSVYYWRESNGLEIDCIVEKGNKEIMAIAIKGGLTFNKGWLKNFRTFQKYDMNIRNKIIYAGETSTVLSGIRVVSWYDLLSLLNETI